MVVAAATVATVVATIAIIVVVAAVVAEATTVITAGTADRVRAAALTRAVPQDVKILLLNNSHLHM
ncbi:hypothetical protein D1872_293870 [compost metagenome]